MWRPPMVTYWKGPTWCWIEATSRRTARNVIKKLTDARKFRRWGRSGIVCRMMRPSLVRCSSNSMSAVTAAINTSRITSPDQCIRHSNSGKEEFFRPQVLDAVAQLGRLFKLEFLGCFAHIRLQLADIRVQFLLGVEFRQAFILAGKVRVFRLEDMHQRHIE